jgi:hypothetical protein
MNTIARREAWPKALVNRRQELVDLNVDDNDALGLEIVIQSFGAVLATDTAGLYAAEREFVVTVVKRVDPDIAGLEFVDGLVGVNQIARPD